MSKTKKYNKRGNIKKRNTKSKKNMKGGFTDIQTQALQAAGFQQEQIDVLNAANVTIDTINQAINYYNDTSNSHEIIVSIAKNLQNSLPALHNIGSDSDSNSVSDNSQSNASSLHMSDLGEAIPQDANDNHDLDVSNDSIVSNLSDESGKTDEPSMNESEISMNANENPHAGGRRRNRGTKKRLSKLRRNKSYRKVKGGATMYGTGYGANCNNPNFSIYNTNLTKLFPYRP